MSNRLVEFFRYQVLNVFHKTTELVKQYPIQSVIIGAAALFAGTGTAAGLAVGTVAVEAGLQTATGRSLFTKQGWAELAQEVKDGVMSEDRFKLTTNKVLVGGALGAGYMMGGALALPILGAVYLGAREFGNRTSPKIVSQTDGADARPGKDDDDIPNFRF
ncbi:MAG: hypothetical protein Alpg2KO_33630 [Alphaproteobacteria bacterium]